MVSRLDESDARKIGGRKVIDCRLHKFAADPLVLLSAHGPLIRYGAGVRTRLEESGAQGPPAAPGAGTARVICSARGWPRSST
jgi:hypothetical protein